MRFILFSITKHHYPSVKTTDFTQSTKVPNKK